MKERRKKKKKNTYMRIFPALHSCSSRTMEVPPVSLLLSFSLILVSLSTSLFSPSSLAYAEDRVYNPSPYTPLPLTIGHRGYSSKFPQNTLLAFREAIKAGAEGFETDLRFTKDGVLVLMHDYFVDLTTNCTGNVEDFTYEEIRSCNAGYREFDGKYMNYTWEDIRVPSFKEAVELAAEHGVFIVMDLKVFPLGKGIKKVFDEVNEDGSRHVATAWTIEQAQDIRDHLSVTIAGKLGFLDPDKRSEVIVRESASLGFHGYSLKFDTLTPEFVRVANSHFMPVVTWTLNTRAEFIDAMRVGVTGVITNDVGLLLEVRKEARELLSSLDEGGEREREKETKKKTVALAVVVGLSSVFIIAALSVILWQVRLKWRIRSARNRNGDFSRIGEAERSGEVDLEEL